MIKKGMVLLALLAVSAISTGKDVLIGEQEIELPVQAGFLELPESHIYTQFMQDFTPESNELLVIQAPENELTENLEMIDEEFSQSIVIQTFKGTKYRQVTKAEFGQVKDFMKQNFEQLDENLRQRINKDIDTSSKKVSSKYDVDVALSINDMVPLEIYADTGNHYGATYLMKSSLTVDGGAEDNDNVLMAINILLVKGKIIYLYVYSMDEDTASQQELLKLTEETVSRVLQSNSS